MICSWSLKAFKVKDISQLPLASRPVALMAVSALHISQSQDFVLNSLPLLRALIAKCPQKVQPRRPLSLFQSFLSQATKFTWSEMLAEVYSRKTQPFVFDMNNGGQK